MTPFVAFMKDIAEMTRQFVLDQTSPLKERITILEHENKALQALIEGLAQNTKGTLRFRDTWRPDAIYVPGDVCIRRGSSWCCIKDSVGIPPGSGNTDQWRLMVERGRDGRDAAA
jgi:hypothetical protein